MRFSAQGRGGEVSGRYKGATGKVRHGSRGGKDEDIDVRQAFNAAKGPTKFKDVASSHWASGAVNLAEGAGIMKGYPDGTFKPDECVSYAELSAMLVGVLGYTPKLQGTWPSNVISKATELGLLDGVNVTDYNTAALRSDVFLAADNALDTKSLIMVKDGYEVDTKTLVERKFSEVVK